jgi:hypothetical protein
MALPKYAEARMAIVQCLEALGFDTNTNAQVRIRDWPDATIATSIAHTGAFLSFSPSGVDKLVSAQVSNPVLEAFSPRARGAFSAAR